MQLWVMLRGSPRLLCGVGGVRVDQTDSAGDTALSHSCCAGQAAVLATLLQAGARPDTQDRDGVTPLHKVISHSAQIRETRWLNSCGLVQVVGRGRYWRAWQYTVLCCIPSTYDPYCIGHC